MKKTNQAALAAPSNAALRRDLRKPNRPLSIDAFRERCGRIVELEGDGHYIVTFEGPDGPVMQISPAEIGRRPGHYRFVQLGEGEDGAETETVLVECDTSMDTARDPSMRPSGPMEATLVHGMGQLTQAWDSILARTAVEATQTYEREKALREENDMLRARVTDLESKQSGFSNPETLEKLVPLAVKGLEVFARTRTGEDAIIDRWLDRLTPETRLKVCEELEAWEQRNMLAGTAPSAAPSPAPTNGASAPNPHH